MFSCEHQSVVAFQSFCNILIDKMTEKMRNNVIVPTEVTVVNKDTINTESKNRKYFRQKCQCLLGKEVLKKIITRKPQLIPLLTHD